MAPWHEHVEREARRYEDGLARLPAGADARQKQLVRVANAACGAGLAELMAGHVDEARLWFRRSAERYRESFADAPSGSWGRLIGAIKMRLLGGDDRELEGDARWALAQGPAAAESPIGRYAATLALLALGRDAGARALAATLASEPAGRFPAEVADALAGLASGNGDRYEEGLAATLRSFETRDEYLEDVPVAETVLVLEALAERRRIAVCPVSPLLPPPRS